jgi:uncharacterized protein (DUF1330 family)
MSAYALAHLRETDRHPEILEYMERIQDTLDPFFGRFLVHGADIDVPRGCLSAHPRDHRVPEYGGGSLMGRQQTEGNSTRRRFS